MSKVIKKSLYHRLLAIQSMWNSCHNRNLGSSIVLSYCFERCTLEVSLSHGWCNNILLVFIKPIIEILTFTFDGSTSFKTWPFWNIKYEKRVSILTRFRFWQMKTLTFFLPKTEFHCTSLEAQLKSFAIFFGPENPSITKTTIPYWTSVVLNFSVKMQFENSFFIQDTWIV